MPIVNAMNAAVGRAMSDPAVTKTYETLGNLPKIMSSSEFGSYVKQQEQVWGGIVKQSGVSLD